MDFSKLGNQNAFDAYDSDEKYEYLRLANSNKGSYYAPQLNPVLREMKLSKKEISRLLRERILFFEVIDSYKYGQRGIVELSDEEFGMLSDLFLEWTNHIVGTDKKGNEAAFAFYFTTMMRYVAESVVIDFKRFSHTVAGMNEMVKDALGTSWMDSPSARKPFEALFSEIEALNAVLPEEYFNVKRKYVR